MQGVRRTEQKRIAAALKQWSVLRAKKGRIEAERDQAIEPHRMRFEQKCAPHIDRANQKLAPVEQQIQGLEDEIAALFMAALQAGSPVEFTRIDVTTAVAEVITRTEREIDARTFFEGVPPSRRNSAFWCCLKTLIGKAEKFLGADRLNELAHTKRTHQISIREVVG